MDSTQIGTGKRKVSILLCLFTLIVPFLMADQAAGQAVVYEAPIAMPIPSAQAMATNAGTGEEFYIHDPLGLAAHRCSYFCQIESTLDTDRVLLGEPVLVLGGEVVVVVLVSFEL